MNTIYVSGTQASSQGNFGVLTVLGTEYIVRSGKDTLVGGPSKIWYGSSQACKEVWLSSISGAQLVKSGSVGDNKYGVALQADVVYQLPVHNTNLIWLSGCAGSTVNWTAFA